MAKVGGAVTGMKRVLSKETLERHGYWLVRDGKLYEGIAGVVTAAGDHPHYPEVVVPRESVEFADRYQRYLVQLEQMSAEYAAAGHVMPPMSLIDLSKP